MKNYIRNIVQKAVMDAYSNRILCIMVMIDKYGQNIKVHLIANDDEIDEYYDNFAVLHGYKSWIIQLSGNLLDREEEIEGLSQSIYKYIYGNK